jgi:Domain of unknown function (DUF4282)
MIQKRSFIESLFDLSFNSFIITKVAGVIYAIGIGFTGLTAMAVMFSSLSMGGGALMGAIIGVPLLVLLNLIFMRMALESLISTIKTAENTTVLAEAARRSHGL